MLGHEFDKMVKDAVQSLSAGGDRLFSHLYHGMVQKLEFVSGKVLTDVGDRIVRFADSMASEYALSKNKGMDLTNKFMGVARNLCGLIPGCGFGGQTNHQVARKVRDEGYTTLAADDGQPVTTAQVYSAEPGCMSIYARDILLQCYHEDELMDGDGEGRYDNPDDPHATGKWVNNVDRLFPANAPGINATINQMALTLGSASPEEAQFIYDYMGMFVHSTETICAIAGRPYFYVDFKRYVGLLGAGFYTRLEPDLHRIADFLKAKGIAKRVPKFRQMVGEREGILDRHIAGLLTGDKDSNNDKKL